MSPTASTGSVRCSSNPPISPRALSNVRVVQAEQVDRELQLTHAFVFTDPTTEATEEATLGGTLSLDDGEFMLLLDPLGGV